MLPFLETILAAQDGRRDSELAAGQPSATAHRGLIQINGRLPNKQP